MTTYKPLVQDDSIVAQLDPVDALDVTTIDTATLTLTGNLDVTLNTTLNIVTMNLGSANFFSVITALQTPSISSLTGTVNFTDDHITTTGNLSANHADVVELAVIDGSIMSASGTINFDDENLVTTGNLTSNNATFNAITDLDYIDFDLTPNIPGRQTGRLHWHEADGTLSLGMVGSEVELQIGQEHLILVKNVTGNTINNGTPVYFTGVGNGRPTVATGNATRAPSPVPSLIRGLLTETINTGNEGYMIVAGLMRDVNTANWAPNTQLYLSTIAGEYTNPRPEAPDNVRGIGVVIIQHATEGSILVSLDPIYDLEWASNIYNTVPFETDQFYGWQPTGNRYELLRSQRNFFNGTTRETFDATINSTDNTTIQLYLEQAGGGDLTMQFTDGDTQLDCTPTQTINITPGTDTSPAGTMVYIPLSTKLLTSNSVWPDEEHIKICYLAVPSAQFVYDHGGPYVNQNWNDHLSDTEGVVGQGHLSHIAGKIRLALGASWYSGVNPDGQDDAYFTYPAASTIYWESTAGVIAQLHPQTFGAKDTGNGNILLVANDFVAPYTHVSNLFDITDDSTGNTIGNNRYFSLIFWGVQNKSDQGSGVVINLPAGNYTSELSATLDTGGYDDYNFPREFTLDSGTAFLICRSTFKMGTNGWTHIQTEDLRGKVPSNQVGGGGGGGVTDHGALGGLADDDHTQYTLVDGTRAFTVNSQNGLLFDTGNNSFGTTDNSSIVLLGADNTVNGISSAILAGDGNTITGDYSTILGGSDCSSSDDYCTVMGRDTVASHWGELAGSGGSINVDGDAQWSRLHLTGTTTSGVNGTMYLDGSAKLPIMTPNSIWYISGIIVGTTGSGGNGAGYRVKAAYRRNGTASPALIANASLTNPSLSIDFEDDPGFNFSIGTTGNSIVITVIQPVGFGDIKWSAMLDVVQVNGAAA